jgi:hypothetical protein
MWSTHYTTLALCNNVIENNFELAVPMLSGSLVVTAWHGLRLQIEAIASRYGG